MVPPSPELQRKYGNTDQLVKSGRSYLIDEMLIKYPNDYIDLLTYESIKRNILR
jgi:hypothetical protein